MHDLGQEVIGLAEIRQQLLIAVGLGMSGDGTSDEMEAEPLCAVVGVQFYPLAIQPFPLRHHVFAQLGISFMNAR